MLLALGQIHERFAQLTIIGTEGANPLPADLGGLEAFIEKHAFSPDHPADYLELSCDGTLGPDSLSRIGFSITYCSADTDTNSIVPPERGGIDLTLRGSSAGVETNAHARLQLPIDAETELNSKATIKVLLQTMLKGWRGGIGGVSLRQYLGAVRGTDRASYAGQWLFYLPFPGLAKCLPPDIRHEPFANGILIETTPHLPDANNPAHIAAGKRVRDVLDELGLINDATYAIEGWPPDQEESLYEQFISGAPHGRKYTVHCVNFDGYDPHRKVLLYAKLFRRLKRHPKEWGLRGWDGPVLNEAKRQVRAAAKAGGVRIEWHIGLEEPANAVRQLLVDHTNITDEQLRVLHTPLEEAQRSPQL
jgi:hypothetical protein